MIIHHAAKIERADIVDYSWFSLRAFHNTRHTAELIMRLHKPPKKYIKNVEKQADQIRFFLLQAREYFQAGRAVTLVTKPVLLYYCAMCLATAEVLFKQSGDSSLDKARESHRHHGLSFTNRNAKIRDSATIQDAAALVAHPAINGKGERYGTFELWHRSARGYLLPGEHVTVDSSTGSQINSFMAFGISADERLPLLPQTGITLLDALTYIPGMAPLLHQFGGAPSFVRGHVTRLFSTAEKRQTMTIVIHPGLKDKLNAFFEECLFNANDEGDVAFRELQSGGIISITHVGDGGTRFKIPGSTCERFPDICFFPGTDISLNEFGHLYVALYIVGNYARYYPDFWIHDVEKNTQLGLLIEHLMIVAEQRIGLLTLSELSRVFYVPA